LAKPEQSFLKIVSNLETREATIYIYGAIGGYDPDTYKTINTADKFSEEFRAVEKEADTIHVRINSPGGRVFEGLAIYNTLFASQKKIITYNDGICASMAALILLSGDEIHAFSNSLLMIHNSSNMFVGNKKQVEEQLETSEKIDISMGTAIEERLGITAAEVEENYLNYKDNWFTSKEAESIGFYDKIIKKSKAVVPTNAASMSSGQLFEQYAAMSFTIPTQKQKPHTNMSKPNSFPNLEATLGLNAPLASTDNGSYLNEEQKAAIENQLTANATSLKTAQHALQVAEANLQTEKDALAAEKAAQLATENNGLEALKAAATLAGVESIAEDASAADVQAALTAQINVLNGKPGASHTGGAADIDNDPSAHSYVDFNNSIYSQIKK